MSIFITLRSFRHPPECIEPVKCGILFGSLYR
ncbi:MAG: hypothetical protein EBX50_21350 [Chitinophagia bacterium]|nr:hypothetical protein [Chitinophagia bacterium]